MPDVGSPRRLSCSRTDGGLRQTRRHASVAYGQAQRHGRLGAARSALL